MGTDEAAYRNWLELVAELMRQSTAGPLFSDSRIPNLLVDSFRAGCCTLNHVDLDWVDHVLGCWPNDYIPDRPPGGRQADWTWQPLLRWYALTGETAPQSSSRIPSTIVGARLSREWADRARPLGIEFQLSIPVLFLNGHQYAYVLSRHGQGFNEGDILMGRVLQPILTALFTPEREVVRNLHQPCGDPLSPSLTQREMTILCLLSRGLTAECMGHQLNISSRTVSKHLEHIYRKLGVKDRLTAVVRASQAGLNLSGVRLPYEGGRDL